MRSLRLAALGLLAIVVPALAADVLAPGEVTPIAPVAGADIETIDVTFTMGNAADPDSTVVDLRLELWLDLLGNIAFAGSVAQTTSGQTSLVVGGVGAALEDDHTYFWRARAVDSAGNMGPWSTLRPFFYNPENDPPVAGDFLSPIDYETVSSLLPGFVVVSPTDPDDTSLTVRFEIATDPEWGQVEMVSPNFPAGPTTTSWVPYQPLRDNTLYLWKTVVSDGVSETGKQAGTFLVNLENDPPSTPTIVAPANGADVTTTSPVLVAGGANDPEGGFAYHFDIDRAATFSSLDLQQSGAVVELDAGAQWTPPLPLVENVTYFWRVRGKDAVSFGEAAFSIFRVNVVNDAPAAPIVLDPAPGETIVGSLGQVAFVPGVDPEGTDVNYVVTVLEGDDGAVVATASGSADAGPVTLAVFDEPVPPGRYTVRVVVADALGLEGAMTSVPVRIRTLPKADPGACAIGEGARADGRAAAALALMAIAITGCRRRIRR